MHISSTVRIGPGQNLTFKNRSLLTKTVEITYPGPTFQEEEIGTIPPSGSDQLALSTPDGFYPANPEGRVLLPGLASDVVYDRNPKLDTEGRPVITNKTDTIVAPGLLSVAGSGLAMGAAGAVAAGGLYAAMTVVEEGLRAVTNIALPFLGPSSGGGPVKALNTALALGGAAGFLVGAAITGANFGREHSVEWTEESIRHKALTGANAKTVEREVRIGTAPEPYRFSSKAFSPVLQTTEVGRYSRPVVVQN